jgi:hypothetical protein
MEVQEQRVYASRRIVAGIYIQPTNDGERLMVVAHAEDGWGWGPLSKSEGARIERLAEHEPDEALSELRWIAGQNGPFTSKRDAITSALA